ncbi:MAG: porin family protein [Mesorhizobium sp.]|nr:porin family protein [Mesorhizobium sp.]
MKTTIKLAAAFGLIAFASMSARAADMIDQAPEPQPYEVVPSASTGWAGPYVGVYGGYTFGETSIPGLSVDHDGFAGGAFAGWSGQTGAIVYGIEGDVGYNGADGANGGLATRSGVEGSLRARLGYAVNDRLLVYATGGGAAEQLKANDGLVTDKNVMLGYTVGAGVDAKITEQVFARVEYRYTDFGNETFNLTAPTSIDSSSNKIHVGLGLKF